MSWFMVSFLALSPSRFKMRSYDSAKKLLQDTAFCFQAVRSSRNYVHFSHDWSEAF